MTEENVSLAVRTALAKVHGRVAIDDVELHMSVIDDLGLDSVRFVDLAVTLEDLLGIREFPLQDWYDAEALLEVEPHFTVLSLVEACLGCVAKQATAADGR